MCGEICAVIPLRKHIVFDVYAFGYMAWTALLFIVCCFYDFWDGFEGDRLDFEILGRIGL